MSSDRSVALESRLISLAAFSISGHLRGAVRACALEMKSGYHLKRQPADLETQRQDDGAVDETEKLRKGVRQVLERRHRQFGFYEALLVGSGTMLVALGCVLYLVGVLIESH
jgi:hypothetical protein